MANAIFAYDNLAAIESTSITATSALVTHPASRFTDGMLSQRCWLDAHTGIINIDMGGTPASWGLVALLGTNLGADLTVKLESTNDASWATVAYGPVDLPVSPAGSQGNRWLYLSADRSERYLRLVIGEAVGGSDFPENAKIGQLLLASPLRLSTNFSQSYAVQNMAGANVVRTAFGVTRAYKLHESMENWQVPFSLYPRVDREKLLDMWTFVDGPCKALLFIPDPDDADRLALWCRSAEALQSQFDYWKFHDLGSLMLSLVEEPMAEELDTLPGNHSALALLLDPSDGVLKDEVSGTSFIFTRSTQGTYIHPDTGVITTAAIDEARFEKIRGKKALLMEGQTTQHLLNSQTPATQTSGSLAIGTYILWCEGTGSAAVAANTATITGAGTATQGVPVVFEVTAAGTVDVTVTGTLTFFQLEAMPIETSHIYSTTSATVRGADVCTLALSSDVKKILSLHETLTGLTPDATYTSGVWADLSDDSGFVLVDSQDISAHAGGLVVVTDSAGKRAWAWTKPVLGSQTLGAEKLEDPGFDNACGVTWSCGTGWSIAGSQASKASGVAWQYFGQSEGLTAKKLYQVEIDIASLSGGDLHLELFGNGYSIFLFFATSGTHTRFFATESEAVNWLGFNCDSTVATVINTASIKEITSPGATGLLCFKSDGSTRGWAGEESGFDPNDIASAKFYPSDSGLHAGTAIIAWVPGFGPTDLAANQNIIATDNAAAPLNVTTAGSLHLIDSADNEARLDTFNWEAGGYYRLLCQWNFTDSKINDLPAGKMRVGYMATTGAITWLGTPADYCGAMDMDGTLRLARSFAYLAHFGRLALYSTVLSDDEVRQEAFK